VNVLGALAAILIARWEHADKPAPDFELSREPAG
jgi:hypothetical protein